MIGWRVCAKLRNKQTPNAQPQSLKTRWMTILTFLLRSGFYSNRFVKRTVQWIKTKWRRHRHAHGWNGGNGLTLFWILKLRLTSPFHTKWHSWQKSARRYDAKRIGSGATNSAS